VRPGGLGEGAQEGIHPEAMGEVPVGPIALVGDPRHVGGRDALGPRSLKRRRRWPAGDHIVEEMGREAR
jgi:hypothetical protein